MVVGEGLYRIGDVNVMEPGAEALNVVDDTLLIHRVDFMRLFQEHWQISLDWKRVQPIAAAQIPAAPWDESDKRPVR